MSGEDMYSGRLPEVYDLMYPDIFGELDAFRDFIAERAEGKRVLEFGVGTGRLAIPLAEAGFEVSGMDVSPGMLAVLGERDADHRITIHEGNFILDRVNGEFDVVLLMINTLFVAKTLDEQISVFQNAADSLAPGGFFLIETFNPSHYHQLRSAEVQMRNLDESTILLEQYIAEPTSQLLVAQSTVLGRGEPFGFTHVLRYSFPLELDAVARNAGLTVTERVAHWSGIPYTDSSGRCLSVYRKVTK